MSKDLKDYLYFSDVMIKISDLVDKSEMDILEILDNFYKQLHALAFINYCNRDVLPDAVNTYFKILKKLPKDNAIESFNFVYDNYEPVITKKTLSFVLEKYPETSDSLFNKIYKSLNDKYSADKLVYLYLIAQNTNGVKKKLYLSQIFDYLNNGSNLVRICKLLNFHNENNFVLNIDNSVIDNLFEMVSVAFMSPMLNTETADDIINLLVRIHKDFPEYRKRSAKILKQIKNRTDIINSVQKRKMARIFYDTEDLRSNVEIAKRIEKTIDDEHGCKIVDAIPIDEACILVLGGNGSDSPKNANGYMKNIEYLLSVNGLEKGVGIYSVIYDFGDSEDKGYYFNDHQARIRMAFENGRRRLHALVSHRSERYVSGIKFKDDSPEQTNPRYIEKLFNIAILPRISQDGQKIDVEFAKRYIRNLNIFAHCHGGYTFLKLEEMMQKKMAELGYTKQEMKDIQKQLLCIGFAPYCPLGISKSTFISFCSAMDFNSKYYNLFELLGRPLFKDNIAWFPDKLGNVFVVPEIGQNRNLQEHMSYVGSASGIGMSENGKIMVQMEKNAIINGIRNSLENGTIPTVKQLVAGDDREMGHEFDMALINGREKYKAILERIKTERENGRKI